VLARVFLVDGWYGKSSVMKELWDLSETYTPKKSTAAFNQAMMDLGASLCSRSKPQCESCPLSKVCAAFIDNKTDEYPHKKPRKILPVKHAQYILKTNQDNQVQLVKRPPAGIWGGLWTLPEAKPAAKTGKLIEAFRHTFSHYHLEIKVVSGSKPLNLEENSALAWHNIDELKDIALPTPIKKFLFKHFKLNG
jgi:A/G-specific adenine glycosylase